MTEPQWMVDHLKDDLALQLYAFKRGYIRGPRPGTDHPAGLPVWATLGLESGVNPAAAGRRAA